MGEGKQAAAPNVADLQRVLLVGLGNPGSRYADSRHNIGFMVLEALGREHGIAVSGKKFEGLYGDGGLNGKRVGLLLPQTFMNLSGRSVAQALRYGAVERGGLVVVHDDVDLPFGRIRLKWAGGNAGHNGLRSIDASLGTADYFRVRVGIGRPERGSVHDYVLSRFSDEQRQDLSSVLDGAAEAIERLLREGLLAAQNATHSQVLGQEGRKKGAGNQET